MRKNLALVRIRKGWEGAGRIGRVLGNAVMVQQWWTPVLWEDEDDPNFFKTAGLEDYVKPRGLTKPQTIQAAIEHLRHGRVDEAEKSLSGL